MRQFWLSAPQALSLLTRELGGEYPAVRALCKRAHAGLLTTYADLFVTRSHRLEKTQVPKEFWWAEGEEALEQDWAQGDFSTWIDQRQLKAFGVRFDFEGIAAMLAPQRASLALRNMSVAANSEWLSAKEARTFVFDRFKVNPFSACGILIDQCQLGFVPARAALMERRRNGHKRVDTEIREWDVPRWFWQSLTHSEKASQDWERGVFSAHGIGSECVFTYSLTSVHVERAALEALAPRRSDAKSSSAAAVGRPRKEWWDDMWCAVWGQIVHGELTPTNQADIERAMLQWVADRGETVAESTVKPMAKKVWLEWDREARN